LISQIKIQLCNPDARGTSAALRYIPADAVHLIDQRLDPGVVQAQTLDQIHRLIPQLLEAPLMVAAIRTPTAD
jgi:hypothetical protein